MIILGLVTLEATGQAEPAAHESEPIEVEVTGRRPPESSPSSRDPSAASTVIRGRALQEPGATSADVLERVPGVQVNRTGARSDLATASIRGATPAQLPVYLAGIRLNDDVSGTADLSTVPLWMLERVEVFRGNAPAHADQLGLAGAVFFEPRLPSHSELNAGATLGSYAYEALWSRIAVGSAQSSALVGVRREGAENSYAFVDDRGTRFDRSDDVEVRRQNADFGAYDAWAIARHRLGGAAQLTTLVNAYDREQGVTGLSVIPARRARAHVRRLLAGVSAHAPCAASDAAATIACRIELATSALLANSVVSDPAGELGLTAPGVANHGQRVTQRVRVTRPVSESFELALALQGESERLSVEQFAAGTLAASRTSGRAAATASLRATNILEVLGLGAVEAHATRGGSESANARLVEPSGRVGLRVGGTTWFEVLTNLGSYVRIPSLAELYGVSPLVRGNPELRPESGYTADLGVRAAARRSPRAAFEGFVFWREASELIGYRRSSFGVIRPYNTADARVYGIEAAGWLELFERLRLSAEATAMQPVDTTAGRRTFGNQILPYRARFVASSRAELHSAALTRRNDNRVSLGVELLHRSSRYADPAGLIVINGHSALDVDLTVALFESRLFLRAICDNVLDARAYDSVGLPLPGRSFFASMELYAH